MSGALSGLHVVNTRAAHQAAELDRVLLAAGAVPLSFPCINIVPVGDSTELNDAIDGLLSGEFEWLVFTSVNSVFALKGKLRGQELNARVAAIGPATAGAVERELALEVAIVPEAHAALELASAIPIKSGDRVLIPASAIAHRDLQIALETRGAVVTPVSAYSTVIGAGGVDLRRLLADGQVDALTFASPSAIRGLLARFDADGGAPWEQFGLLAVCIGENTVRAAAELGFASVFTAADQSVEGLVVALESVLSTGIPGGRTWP